MRRRSGFAAIAVLLAAAIVCWLELGGTAPASTPADTDGTVTAPAVGNAGRSVDPRRDAPTENDTAARTTAEPAPAPAAAGATLDFVVVDAEGHAVADAEVLYYVDRDDLTTQQFMQRMMREPDREQELRHFGTATRSDAAGHAQVPLEARNTIAARSGDLYGEFNLDFVESRDHRIVLRDDVTLRARVVDPRGRPQRGIQVVADGSFLDRGNGQQEQLQIELGISDSDGLVRVRHLQSRMALPAETPQWSLALRCLGTHLENARCAVTPEMLRAAEPVQLVVPEGGLVIATVVDGDGRPCMVQPALESEDGSICCTPTSEGSRGVHAFRQVPMGRRWRLFAPIDFTGGVNREFVELRLKGPTAAEPTVEATLVVPRVTWVLQGRVRRSDGKPIDRMLIFMSATIEDASGKRTPAPPTSAWVARGGIRFFFMGPPGERVRDIVLHVQHAQQSDQADIAVPQVVARRGGDLGEIVVPPPPDEFELATVTVFLRGVDVTAECGMGINIIDGDRLQAVEVSHNNTSNGRILTGKTSAENLELGVSHNGGVTQRQRIARGAHVRVDLDRAAELTVSFAPGSVPDMLVHGELQSVEGGSTVGCTGSCYQSKLTFVQLPPGRYRLVVHFHRKEVLSQVLPPLQAGANTWPPDGPIDLRPEVVVIHVGAETADGKPAEGFVCATMPAGSTTPPENGFDTEGSYGGWLVASLPRPDLLVGGFDHMPVRVPRVDRDLVVHLASKTELQIRCAEGRIEPGLTIDMNPIQDPVLRAFDLQVAHPSYSIPLDATTPATIRLAPGTVFTLQRRPSVDGGNGPAQQFVVAPDGPQVIVVR